MRHVIDMPDVMAGREMRRIVWDDAAGTVEGDHELVYHLRRWLAQEPPIDAPHNESEASRVLRDPRRDPADFMALLTMGPYWRLQEGAEWHRHLPPSLRGVTPTPPETIPLEPGEVA